MRKAPETRVVPPSPQLPQSRSLLEKGRDPRLALLLALVMAITTTACKARDLTSDTVPTHVDRQNISRESTLTICSGGNCITMNPAPGEIQVGHLRMLDLKFDSGSATLGETPPLTSRIRNYPPLGGGPKQFVTRDDLLEGRSDPNDYFPPLYLNLPEMNPKNSLEDVLLDDDPQGINRAPFM